MSTLGNVTTKVKSVGGMLKWQLKNIMDGLGEGTMFEKLDQNWSNDVFYSAVKGVEIGTGFSGANLYGSLFNDVYEDETGKTLTNHSGGVSGGISNGNDLIVKVFVKPTSSIGKVLHSI